MPLIHSKSIKSFREVFKLRRHDSEQIDDGTLVSSKQTLLSETTAKIGCKLRKRDMFRAFLRNYWHRHPPDTSTLVSADDNSKQEMTGATYGSLETTTDGSITEDTGGVREYQSLMPLPHDTLDPFACVNGIDTVAGTTTPQKFRAQVGSLRMNEFQIQAPLSGQEDDIFQSRFDHSFTIHTPTMVMPELQHKKWERSQMLRHTASKHDLTSLKSKRSQLFDPESTPKRPSNPASANGLVHSHIGNFLGFFKSFTSLLTNKSKTTQKDSLFADYESFEEYPQLLSPENSPSRISTSAISISTPSFVRNVSPRSITPTSHQV